MSNFALRYNKGFPYVHTHILNNLMYVSAITGKNRVKRALCALALVFSFLLFAAPDAAAQRLALKTNALEYLILSPNLTFEARMSRKLSLQLGVAVNPVTRPISGYKMSNFRVEPELRYWFNRPMARHFIALSTTAGSCSLQLKERYIMCDVVAAGVSYGYSVVLSRHWNMELEIGVGLASLHGYDYRGENNKPDQTNLRKTMPVPVRCGLTFGYIFR